MAITRKELYRIRRHFLSCLFPIQPSPSRVKLSFFLRPARNKELRRGRKS
jgi:hypothetical protein